MADSHEYMEQKRIDSEVLGGDSDPEMPDLVNPEHVIQEPHVPAFNLDQMLAKLTGEGGLFASHANVMDKQYFEKAKDLITGSSDDVFGQLAPGGGGLGEIMRNMSKMVEKVMPKNTNIGNVVLSHLQQLYIDGNTFHIFYKDDFKGVCVYDTERIFPEGKYFVQTTGEGMAPKREVLEIAQIHPFFFIYKTMKEDWMNAMIKNDLAFYILEFTEYFLDNDTPEHVLEDMKISIIESKIMCSLNDKGDEKFENVDSDVKNMLRARFELFL